MLALLGGAVVSNAQTLSSDNFNSSKIDDNWIIVNPNPWSEMGLNGDGEFNLSASPLNGGSDLCNCTNYHAPRILQAIDPNKRNWTVEAKVRYNPNSTFQSAGILLHTSNDLNDEKGVYRAIERTYYPAQGGQIIGYAVADSVGNYLSFSDTVTWLRCQRADRVISFWYSADGENWSKAGEIDDRDIYYVGLFATRNASPWSPDVAPANFDYFMSFDPTSIATQESNQKFILSPNPAQHLLTVTSKNSFSGQEVLLYNAIGQEVKTTGFMKSAENLQVDVSALPKGVYQIKIGDHSTRFVKD